VAAVARARVAPVVVVTNEVGLGIVPATPSGRAYRDLLGRVNSTFVEQADRAALVVAGRLLRLDPPAALGNWAWTTS
jgi:adenosylcobinamide kinase/adenosylcobinamide-phosphate guanylyltransferase